MVLRLRLATARQRLTRAGAQISSFDLRARAAVLRRRIEQRGEELRLAIDRVLVAKRHRSRS